MGGHGKRKNRRSSGKVNTSADSISNTDHKRKRLDDVTSENIFEALSEAGDGSTVASEHRASGIIVSSSPSQAIRTKLPPLVVKSIPLCQLHQDVSRLGVEADLKLTSFGTKVMTRSQEGFDKVQKFLRMNAAEFFTHDVQGSKPFKSVIRGLPLVDVDEIKKELQARYKLQPINVFRMTRKEENSRQYRDCMYLVHFAKGTVTLSALKAVSSLFHIVIRWEKYRGGNRDVTQCMRCLNFGHGTRNCNMKPRCNVCAQNHDTSECSLSEDATPKCGNCGAEHRASDRQCPKRAEFKEIRKQAATRNQPGRSTKPTAPRSTDANQKAAQFSDSNFPSLQHPKASSQNEQVPNHPPPGFFHQTQRTYAEETSRNSQSTESNLMTAMMQMMTELMSALRSFTEQITTLVSTLNRHNG